MGAIGIQLQNPNSNSLHVNSHIGLHKLKLIMQTEAPSAISDIIHCHWYFHTTGTCLDLKWQ